MIRALRFALPCLLGAGLLAVYADPLIAMVRMWDGNPMYSYAYTVPPIALYLLWERRRELGRHAPRPAWIAGGIVLAAALFSLALGELAAIQVIQQLSFLVAIVGFVLVIFGATHLRIAAPALGYLLFMVPLWDAFTERLHWPFQNNSARLGVAILHAIGIPAYREGTIVALSNVTLEVARECSGVNYLVAVLALALPVSYLRLTGWRSRAILIGSAIGIAALANGLRVALIGALAYWNVGSPLHGPFHMLHGLFVAGAGYVVLFIGLRILEGRQTHDNTDTSPMPASSGSSSWSVRTVSVLAAACWLLALVGTTPAADRVALGKPLDRLPSQIGGWTRDFAGLQAASTQSDWSQADSQIVRNYRRADGRPATLQIWYFEAQSQDSELVNFRVAALHRDAVPRTIPATNGTAFTANVTRSQGKVALFWYEIDGVPEASQYAAKAKSLWTAVTSGRSNAAAIMLSAPTTDESDDDTVASLQDLASLVHAALAQHWRPALATRGNGLPGSDDFANSLR
jgi:EpsI family protein